MFPNLPQILRPEAVLAGLVLLAAGRLAEGAEEAATYDLETQVVVAQPSTRIDEFSIVSVDYVDAADLQRLAQSTLGETLAWRPGMSSSYYGPGASRPIIRGLEGYRVRLLQDGVGTLDVSDSSPDHGVALEPLLVREIDIHRGPSALLFGNAAIGGAVNARSRLLADERPDSGVGGELETGYESANSGYSSAAYASALLGDLVPSVTGSVRRSDDYAIPGRARTPAYEATFHPLVNDSVAGRAVPVDNPAQRLPNTFHNSRSGSAGLSWFPATIPLTMGGAYSCLQSEYGLPYQYGGDSNDLFGFSSISLQQERLDLDARCHPRTAWLESLHFHCGYADYGHTERFTGRDKDVDKVFDDALFDQQALETRLDWYHQPADWLVGVAGVHWQEQRLTSSFLAAPPVGTSRYRTSFATGNLGLFAMETVRLGQYSWQVGMRLETQSITDRSLRRYGVETRQGGHSLSLASSLTWRLSNWAGLDELALTPALSAIERLPTATERHAFWPNPALQRFLIGGDKDGVPLNNERSLGGEIGVEARRGGWSWRGSYYRYGYENFIFLQDIKGLGNQTQYVEREAVLHGWEAELSWQRRIFDSAVLLKMSVMADTVEGQNRSDDQPLPRLPPRRIGGRLAWEWRRLVLGGEVRHALAQHRVQPETDIVLPELPTEAYTEINLDASCELVREPFRMTAFVRVNNLLNEDRRIHGSFIKEVAPLPARSFSLGLRCPF